MAKNNALPNRRPLAILALGVSLAGFLAWWIVPSPPVAPEVSLTMLSHGPGTLAELRGRPVLVTFWATTCRPCIEELPDLRKLHEQYHARGLTLVAVAMPYDPPSYVKQFTTENQLPWPVALDVDAHVTRAFGVAYAPTSFLIDPQGRIAFQQIGKLDFARVRHLLDRLLPPTTH